ncbi:MAG: response regulator transcription factor [Clostridia bacterium]|nr:response regulator transcription factor [Clostridia bacterium]
MSTVMLVEDDESIRELITYALGAAGFTVRGFSDGAAFRAAIGKELPELVLLDIMLPGEDGLSLLQALRQNARTRPLPVIMLTARGAELDRVKGLDAGADDYIAKPFSVLEMTARVRALLRRSQASQGKVLSIGNVQLDTERRVATVGGEPASLTFKEFELLRYLMENAELALSRDRILEKVWGYDYAGGTRTVDMHMAALRQKLGAAGIVLQTVRGVGYKIGEAP